MRDAEVRRALALLIHSIAVPFLIVLALSGAALAEGSPSTEKAESGPKFRKYYLWSEPAGIALIAYSVVGLTLISERLLAWRRVKSSSQAIAVQVKGLFDTGRPDRSALLAAFAKSDAPLGQVLVYVLQQGIANSPETTLLLLDNALEIAGRRLKKNLALLACVAGTAPFLGLLGTVLGIMDTFNSIASQGFGGPAVISHGIGQALVTTAGGLAVAIPTFVAYNLFVARANNAVGVLREQASRIFVALGEM